jgi:aspartate ammonia-lyase
MRTESDFLGEVQLPADALYGIHSWRATRNFPDQTPNVELIFNIRNLMPGYCFFNDSFSVLSMGEA